MSRLLKISLVLACIGGISGCIQDRTSAVGFRLPDGDPVIGRQYFLSLQCHECHSIAGEDLPQLPLADEPYVELGGAVTHVKTYGELVTAIINPSHKLAEGYLRDEVSHDGKSKMIVYNGHMTVQQLIDIVMFLQPHYEVVLPEFTYLEYEL
jgi:mono/diheme cytochrome c family protein